MALRSIEGVSNRERKMMTSEKVPKPPNCHCEIVSFLLLSSITIFSGKQSLKN